MLEKNSICENDKDCKLGENNMANTSGNYTVIVDGQRFNVTIAEGNADIQVTPVVTTTLHQLLKQVHLYHQMVEQKFSSSCKWSSLENFSKRRW